MTVDEGYIKFNSDWVEGPLPDSSVIRELEAWRRPLFDAGLIGHDNTLGVGYGNLSIRFGNEGQFVISGTQTGHLPETTGRHYALVTAFNVEQNLVRSTGPVEASSESLTHAALYKLDPGINAVVHIHSDSLWNALRGRLPTTGAGIAYGTPQMARELGRLYRETPFASGGVAIMDGHLGGIISFGHSLEEAARRVLSLSVD